MFRRNFHEESLFTYHKKNGLFCSNKSLSVIQLLLLLLSGDIELNPGPIRQVKEMEILSANRGMKLFHQNVRGIFNNISLLSEFFQSFQNNIDIFSLSETHLTNDNNLGLYNIPGYTFITKNRTVGKGGSVGMYISDRYSWIRRSELEASNLECIWIELIVKNSINILIGTMYRPPAGSKYLPSNFEKSVDEIFSIISMENKETILMGDMNINFMNKKDNADLKALFTVYGFEQMIKKATRTTKDSSTLIDIILTNNPASIITTEVLPLSISDHDMIACSRKTNNK
jgi:exonuclease III